MPWFIALIVNHICPLSFNNLFLLGWWFQQFLVFIGVSHTFFTSNYSFIVFKQGVPFHPHYGYPEVGVAILFEKKCLANCHLLYAKGDLLVLVYVHSILPPSRFHLAMSLIMPCTLIHPFILFSNAYRMQPLAFQIYKLNELP
jgi:hypothetical protein